MNQIHHHSNDDDLLSMPVRLVGGHMVTLEGVFPIPVDAWNHLLAVLAALRPGLVDAQPERPSDTHAPPGAE